jgi:protein-L-isoaspartate(D-aspartate) O-methyltransferase
LGKIAGKVYAIERHAALAELAGKRLNGLGYDNVEVLVGDGTKGWPEAAPFDAIVVSAGGHAPPPALKEQLAVGGRLVIPVGRNPLLQRLLRITRTAQSDYQEQDLGGVSFVPLVGERG